MEKFRRPKFNSDRGSTLLVVLILALLISVGSAMLLFLREENLRATYLGQRSPVTLSLAKSGVETFMLAWKNVETKYFDALKDCEAVNGLIAAMGAGTGCAGKSVVVLSDATVDPTAGGETYNFRAGSTGCRISPLDSDCSVFNKTFLEMGFSRPEQTAELGQYKFEFQILHVLAASHQVEFRLLMTSPAGVVTHYDFVLQDTARSLLHLEGSGRVVQEQADPYTLCPAGSWAGYRAFDAKKQDCLTFDQAAAGTGLVAFKNRLFGLRPENGQIVDLLALYSGASPGSYLVKSDGTVTGLGKVFIPYPLPTAASQALMNANDLSIIEDQIYYVRGSGSFTQLRMLVNGAGSWKDILICDMASLGWEQSLAGLAGMPGSDPIGRVAGDLASDAMINRAAMFFAKTDSGDLLSVRVTSAADGKYDCLVFKDLSLQQDEYKRTFGFESATLQSQYSIY